MTDSPSTKIVKLKIQSFRFFQKEESLDFEIDEFLLYRVEEFAERIVKKYSPEALKRYEDIRKDKSDMKSRVAQQMKSQATNANHDALLQQTAPARVNRPPRSGK